MFFNPTGQEAQIQPIGRDFGEVSYGQHHHRNHHVDDDDDDVDDDNDDVDIDDDDAVVVSDDHGDDDDGHKAQAICQDFKVFSSSGDGCGERISHYMLQSGLGGPP